MTTQPKKPTAKELFDQLKKQGFSVALTPEAIKKQIGAKMQAPAKSPHAQIAEELIAIQQRNSKGFQVIDVNPNELSRADFYPLIQANVLFELLGQEAISPAAGLYEDTSGGATDTGVLPYWRTIEIPLNGNFLKIEHLPVRTMDDYQWNITGTNPIKDNTRVTNNSDSFTDFSPKHSSDKIFLLNFQDCKDTPLIAKHGDSFHTEFTSIFLTFKTTQARFRITLGYNSTITHVDDRLVNQDVAYSPGHGLFNNSVNHAVPFNFTQRDLNTSFGGYSGGYATILANATLSTDLITNIPLIAPRCYKAGGANTDLQLQQLGGAAATYQYTNDATSAACTGAGGSWQQTNLDTTASLGMTVGWITGFSASFCLSDPPNATTDSYLCEIWLEAVQYSSSGATVSIARRICKLESTLAVFHGTNEGQYSANTSKNFSEPIRYSLTTRESLRVVVSIYAPGGSTSTILYGFSVEGYSWGTLVGMNTKNSYLVAPFAPKIYFTENPYPLDQSIYGNPRY